MTDGATEVIGYELRGKVANITMDDGKANALSVPMIQALGGALDRAAQDEAGAIVLAGRAGVFSGGFHLPTLRGGGAEALAMLRGGFRLAHRLLGSQVPVVCACTGHAVAMGLFLLLSGDHLIGADAQHRLTANEVALGLTVPLAALEILSLRLPPAVVSRVAVTAEPFSPRTAVAVGMLDEVAEPAAVLGRAQEVAEQLLGLDQPAHARTKARVRDAARARLLAGIEEDFPIRAGDG